MSWGDTVSFPVSTALGCNLELPGCNLKLVLALGGQEETQDKDRDRLGDGRCKGHRNLLMRLFLGDSRGGGGE